MTDLPPADLNNLVIEKLRPNCSKVVCYYTSTRPPDGWGVLSSGSGTNNTLSIQPIVIIGPRSLCLFCATSSHSYVA